MRSKKPIIVIAAVVLLVGGFFLVNTFITQEQQVKEEDLLLYENASQGFSLRYPEGYVQVEPKEAGELKVSFSLTEEWEAFLAAPEAQEGPPAVTVEIFQNPENLPTVEWAAGEKRSNLTAGTGDYVQVEVQGKAGIAYGWPGLHDGLSVALADRGLVYVISVTYLTLEDRIVRDFPLFLEFFKTS